MKISYAPALNFLTQRPVWRQVLGTSIIAASTAAPTAAHEAWLLTPSEVEALSRAPLPGLFTSAVSLAFFSLVGCLVAFLALRIEDRLRPFEARRMASLAALAPSFGPVAIRVGLAIMLGAAAFGGLPRHGTAPWISPTLFVPDMQLALAPGWSWLAPAEFLLAAFLLFGLLTRLAALATILLAVLGPIAFGTAFLAYAPHFIAPGLMLAIHGGGLLSIDGIAGLDGMAKPPRRLAELGWTLAFALLGGGFVYLAITCKLTQPTLIMAILDHGQVPLLGLPLAVAALLMTGVELIAGTLLAVGRLTRPIALFLIGAFTFFAVTIGESPLFHANLYGTMAMLALSGRGLPDLRDGQTFNRPLAA